LTSLQKTGQTSEDPNLSIDDRRKSYYPINNNGTPINNRKTRFADGTDLTYVVPPERAWD